MQTTISQRHGELRASDRQYIEEKLPKLTHLFVRLISIEVAVDFQQANPQVEILVSAEHKHDFVAHASEETVTAAFDVAMQKMEQQIRRYKERITDHHRGSGGESEG